MTEVKVAAYARLFLQMSEEQPKFNMIAVRQAEETFRTIQISHPNPFSVGVDPSSPSSPTTLSHNIPVSDHCTVPFRPLLSHLNPPGTHWHLFHPFLICCNLLRLGKWSCWAIQPDCGLLCACVCARVEDRMQLKINTRVAHTRYSCCNSHFKTCQSETLILIYSPAPTFAASIIECCGLQAHTWSYLVIYHI